jgi:hypothetical protein
MHGRRKKGRRGVLFQGRTGLAGRLLEFGEQEAREALAKAQWALQPFADCVHQSGADLTTTIVTPTADRLQDAHFAYKRVRAFLAKSQ